MSETLRGLPAVHRLLLHDAIRAFELSLGRTRVKDVVVRSLERSRARGGDSEDGIVHAIVDELRSLRARTLFPVVNATGVLLHTNLGRAALSQRARVAQDAIAAAYSNLEYDVLEGTRGSRYDRVTDLLRSVTGAADAIVVNNCAAAVLLMLDAFARGRETVVARNQLVEVGGGFRLPDVLTRSGSTLREVGTANKTYLRDYERALSIDTGLILLAHRSNYRLDGFVEEPDPRAVAALAHRCGLTIAQDLGAGALLDLRAFDLAYERRVQDALGDGVDLVAFSGDKLLGGPQCGIIAGSTAAVARLRANPLLRALRVDKSTLAALAATLQAYDRGVVEEEIPLYALLRVPLDALRARAAAIAACVGAARVVESHAAFGGGTLPQQTVPSIAIELDGAHVARRLRVASPPVIARVVNDRTVVDLRTVFSDQDEYVGDALRSALQA